MSNDNYRSNSSSGSISGAKVSSGTRIRNSIVAVVAIVLCVLVFLGTRTPTATASLASLSETAIPLDVALSSQKPSLVEFYANWCTSCQAMAQDMAELRNDYGDRINFVMLNVDNTKWLPEVLHYRVDGIPHFVFMNSQGQAIASAIGEQPKVILADNLEALVKDQSLPHLQERGRISEVEPEVTSQAVQDDPRSHGAQVKAP